MYVAASIFVLVLVAVGIALWLNSQNPQTPVLAVTPIATLLPALTMTSTLIPTAEPTVDFSIRPANCEEARQMGLTAAQAAHWPHLDRDGDGTACHGD